jgi:hypothetical protein
MIEAKSACAGTIPVSSLPVTLPTTQPRGGNICSTRTAWQ